MFPWNAFSNLPKYLAERPFRKVEYKGFITLSVARGLLHLLAFVNFTFWVLHVLFFSAHLTKFYFSRVLLQIYWSLPSHTSQTTRLRSQSLVFSTSTRIYLASRLAFLFCLLTSASLVFKTINVNPIEIQDHLRDFLVQIREFTGEDDTDLYLEEREVRSNSNSTSFTPLETSKQTLSDRPEGRPGGEEKSADVCAGHPQPPRGGWGDAGLAHALLLIQSLVTSSPSPPAPPTWWWCSSRLLALVASVTLPLDHQWLWTRENQT